MGIDVRLDGVLADRVDVRGALHDAYAAAWRETDAELLRLAEIRVAQLLGTAAVLDDVEPELLATVSAWPSTPALSDAAKACLAFAEQFVIDVASMPPELADGVAAHLGDAATMVFTQALLAVEQRQRLTLLWDRLGLASADIATLAPATTRGDGLGPALGRFAAAAVCLDLVDAEATEVVRLRCASYHDCHT